MSSIVVSRSTIGGALGRETCGEALEHGAHLREHSEIEHVHVRDEDAAPRVDLDQALALEPLERLPHRRSPDAEPLLQLPFADDRAGCELERDDELADREVRAVAERLRLGGLGLVDVDG